MRDKVVIEQQGYLFDELIFQEILIRLPIKSILRFKSVSKQWYSTLSSSDFAKAHLIKSPYSHPSAPVNSLFIQSGNNRYLFTYNDDDHISGSIEYNLLKLNGDFRGEKNELFFTGCCNGLICLTPLMKKYFIIWNPATRKMHKFASDGYLLRSRVVCGFGYASSVDDYKYVRVSRVSELMKKSYLVVHVFSIKENKGRKIDFDHHAHALTLYDPPVLINETLYWRAHHSQDGYVIVGFDLGVETFDIIKSRAYLGVMGGCLSKCNDSNGSNIGDMSHMTMRIFESTATVKSIDLPKGLRSIKYSQMIGFTRTGKFFVTGPFQDEIWDFDSKTLGIVDTSTKPAQYKRLLKFDERIIIIARYVPSLVSPFPIEELSRAS